MDRLAYALVSSAAADVLGEFEINFGITYVWVLAQQGGSSHQHPSLAVSALSNIFFQPGLLARMAAVRRQAFNGGVLFAYGGGNRELARAYRTSIFVNGAGATNAHPTAVFSACELQQIAQHPEQRHVRLGRDLELTAVHLQDIVRHAVVTCPQGKSHRSIVFVCG